MHPRPRLRNILGLSCALLLLVGGLFAASDINKKNTPDYRSLARRLLERGLSEQYTYRILARITSNGPRLAGSPGAAAAVKLTREIMRELGFDAVHLEPTEVPHWVRGPEARARLVSSQLGSFPLSIAAIGGSVPTPESGLSAEILEVQNFAELKARADEARGRIVFFNRPMDPSNLDTFSAYGAAADQRVQGAVEAARFGAKAVLVRSLTMRLDDYPHTGMMRYAPDISRIPAACVSTKGAEFLHNTLEQDPGAQVFMSFQCRQMPPVVSHNVVGQITGMDKPREIILLGGHLDCWDLSHGAHDDGAGCAQTLAALRLLKTLGLTPKRTIRAVMFMNEEFGGSGGIDYAAAAERSGERHLAALESDRGGFLPLRLGIGLPPQDYERFLRWEPLFRSVGLQGLSRGGGGVDIGPLGARGTILCGLVPDSQRYFDVHHSAKDVLETVHPRELELGTIVMALFAYLVAEEGI